MSKKFFVFVKDNLLFTRLMLLFTAFSLATMWLSPLMTGQAAAYGQITNRSVTLGTAQSNTATSYTFNFTTVSGGSHLDGIKLIMCTTAIATYPGGTCTKPGTSSTLFSAATYGSISGFTDTTAFSKDAAGANDCVATGHPEVLCLKRTSAGNDTAGAKTLVINGVTNPDATGSFYIGITTYTTNTWTVASRFDAGTVAAAVVQTLQVNAQVAEILSFCVGSTTVDSDSTGTVASDCSGVTGSSVNLGVLDPSKINVTPVSTNCVPADCGKNGVAMVRSNAGNGTVIYYDAVQQSGTHHKGTLRVAGQTCDNSADNLSTNNTDQCFNVSTTGAAFDTSTERFGMTVAGVNCGSTTSYTCTGTANANLVRASNYNGDGSTNTYQSADIDEVNGPTANHYAWDESGTAVQLASSSSSTIKQIDDEALILKFAAHPLIITPFGTYQAQADFIAVSTY